MLTTVFMLDVDNTLLDNDRLKDDLAIGVERLVGKEASADFWRTYEQVRNEEDVVDYPATLRRFATNHPAEPNDELDSLIMNVPFASYLYPRALEAIDYLKTIGTPIVVSDGDQVYQRMKIERSGIWARVDGLVVLTVHKEAELTSVFGQFPAEHYVAVDDKTSILAHIQESHPEVVTVLVCQGKYARLRASPKPDMIVPHIGDIVGIPREEFLAAEDDQVAQALAPA